MRPTIIQTTGNGLAFLVGPDEMAGATRLWPGRPESIVREMIGAEVERIRDELARGVLKPVRLRVVTRLDGRDYERRGWSWEPPVGPGGYVEWLDAAPVPCDRLREWPKTPAIRESRTAKAA
ncbi:MAG: hypothetical protein IT352_07380 [Gemmatimonadales bacterium]|nr:hypothetical protein [Gemmatimonadales bacterium]